MSPCNFSASLLAGLSWAGVCCPVADPVLTVAWSMTQVAMLGTDPGVVVCDVMGAHAVVELNTAISWKQPAHLKDKFAMYDIATATAWIYF